MVDREAEFDMAISYLIQARDMPLAEDPEAHIRRSAERYELCHLASEIIVLDLIPHVQEEGDIFRRRNGS